MSSRQTIEKMLRDAGITVGGGAPHDIKIHNPKLYERVWRGGSLALGEAYMDGWWDAEALDEFFARLLRSNAGERVRYNWRLLAQFAAHTIFNPQRASKAFEIGRRHYDIGNDLYKAMLDRSLTYTCGYWAQARTLDEAQEAKLDLVCRKLRLQPGQKILDIGCGWGSFAIHAAKRYGAHVVGITVSKEQAELGAKLARGLPVEIKLQDYRSVRGLFHHIVSLGMFEHVGRKNYRTYMRTVRDHLHDDGLFLLHTIGRNTTAKAADPWIAKYIFPNSMLPSTQQISQSIERLFVLEDWHNFGADYDKTLLSWHVNVEKQWASLAPKYGERFHRMWTYYLLSSAGAFRSRTIQLWQIVLSKHGVPGGYTAVR